MLFAAGVHPQAFQVVKLAFFGLEYMYHYVYIIYQCPGSTYFIMVRTFFTFFTYFLLYITESRYNNIRRYFMFSLTWNFTKSGAMAPAQEVNILGED